MQAEWRGDQVSRPVLMQLTGPRSHVIGCAEQAVDPPSRFGWPPLSQQAPAFRRGRAASRGHVVSRTGCRGRFGLSNALTIVRHSGSASRPSARASTTSQPGLLASPNRRRTFQGCRRAWRSEAAQSCKSHILSMRHRKDRQASMASRLSPWPHSPCARGEFGRRQPARAAPSNRRIRGLRRDRGAASLRWKKKDFGGCVR